MLFLFIICLIYLCIRIINKKRKKYEKGFVFDIHVECLHAF